MLAKDGRKRQDTGIQEQHLAQVAIHPAPDEERLEGAASGAGRRGEYEAMTSADRARRPWSLGERAIESSTWREKRGQHTKRSNAAHGASTSAAKKAETTLGAPRGTFSRDGRFPRGPQGRGTQRLVRNGQPTFLSVTSVLGHRFVASLSIHCATLSLGSTHIENENELRLIYSIHPPPGSASPEPNDLVTGANVTFYSKHIAAGLYGCHSRRGANDIFGLVWAVLARAGVL